jgi:hypothetical protein
MVVYVPPAEVPIHQALQMVSLGRSELVISRELRSHISRSREIELAVETVSDISTFDFESLDQLVGVPMRDFKIAFKVLQIAQYFTPQISNHKVGVVQTINQDTDEITIELENEDAAVALYELSSLIDIRVFPTFNSKGKQTVPRPKCFKLFEKAVGLSF